MPVHGVHFTFTRVYKDVLGGKGLPGRLFEISGRKADRKEVVRMWTEFMWLVTGSKYYRSRR